MRFDKISPCFWFDTQAEEAAKFYTSVFKNSKIVAVSHYGEAGREVHGMAAGSVLTVAFELEGQTFTALNGGPLFKFNEALSLQMTCNTQEEVDTTGRGYRPAVTKPVDGSRINSVFLAGGAC